VVQNQKNRPGYNL